MTGCPYKAQHGGCHYPDCAKDCPGRQSFTQWRALIAAEQRRGNPYVSFAPSGQDVLDMMDELEQLRAAVKGK